MTSRTGKPALLHRIEWQADAPEPVPVSAEVLTLVTDPLASKERFLRTAPDLPAGWFGDLCASLAALRFISLPHACTWPGGLLARLVEQCGDRNGHRCARIFDAHAAPQVVPCAPGGCRI